MLFRAVIADKLSQQRLMHDPHAMGVGQADRADEIAALPNPVHAGHFAVAIERMKSRPHRHQLCSVAMRADHGDASPDARTLYEGGLADFDAWYVCERIMRAAFADKRQPQRPAT